MKSGNKEAPPAGGESPAPSPMGGASGVPNGDPMTGGGEMPMEDPNAMGGEPMGGPEMGGEEPMGPEMTPPDDMSGEPMGDDMGEMDDLTKRVVDTMKNLTDKDKETISAYADSLRDSSENSENDGIDDEMQMNGGPMGGEEQPEGMGPVSETVIFKKGQLKKINENLMSMEPKEKNNLPLNKNKGKNISKKSPFNSPKFN